MSNFSINNLKTRIAIVAIGLGAIATVPAQANEMMELRLEAMNNSRKTLELTASEADPPTPRQVSASS